MARSRAGIVTGWRSSMSVSRRGSRSPITARPARLQYGLTGRAAALGWPASRVMVIDEDLGRSAANAAERARVARAGGGVTEGPGGAGVGLGEVRVGPRGPGPGTPARQGRGRLAGAASAGPGQHAAQPGLCGDLRLRAQPH